MKKIVINLAAIITALMGMIFVTAAVSAATVDEVAEVARSYGYSEEQIQEGYNEYYLNQEEYPPERLDRVIEKLHEAGSQIITTGSQIIDAYTTTTTTNITTTITYTSGTSSFDQVDVTTISSDNSSNSSITLTTANGDTFERMSRKDFIALSYEDKMAYISTFTPEQQQVIIDDLSPEEYRSMLKQMPSDQKLQVVGTLSQAAEEMGLNITVEEISDDSLTVAMRNSSGELVSRSTAGTNVEDTGYDRKIIYFSSAALFAFAFCVLYFMIRNSFINSERIEEEYEE